MNVNEIKRRLRDDGNGMGGESLKMALEGLVARGLVEVRHIGQKSLYSHRASFLANDVKPWKPESDV